MATAAALRLQKKKKNSKNSIRSFTAALTFPRYNLSIYLAAAIYTRMIRKLFFFLLSMKWTFVGSPCGELSENPNRVTRKMNPRGLLINNKILRESSFVPK